MLFVVILFKGKNNRLINVVMEVSINIFICYHPFILDHCEDSLCKNNATCSSFKYGFNCTCPAGFTGKVCETGEKEWNNNVQYHLK